MMSKENKSYYDRLLDSMDTETRKSYERNRKNDKRRDSEKSKKARRVNYMCMYYSNKF